MNGFTNALSINPDHTTWNVTWTVLTQIQLNCVFLRAIFPFLFYRLYSPALVCVLSSSIWVLNQGWIFLGPTDWKNITDLFVLSVHTSKFLFFYVFFHGACKPFNKPKKSGDWTHKYHKMALLFITHFLYWTFFYYFTLFTFSYWNFFLLFVCFEIRWQLVTTHACNNTSDRDAILRAKMTSLDAIFRRGNKSSSSSLARFCRRKHKKSTAQALHSWKNSS